ncbi:hypothetical protein BGX28_009727 [Mortierella sp. GBA30]|nr:hypothetical protein BGX28_009727 [Mortierella sp. GBA30]
MTTSSAASALETSYPTIGSYMDKKSLPSLDRHYSFASSASSPSSISSAGSSLTPTSPHKTEFTADHGARTTGTVTSEGRPEDKTEDGGFNYTALPTPPHTFKQMAPRTPSPPLSALAAAPGQTESAAAITLRPVQASIGQNAASSFVSKGPHDGPTDSTAKATTTETKTDSRRKISLHQQQPLNEQGQEGMIHSMTDLDGQGLHDNAPTNPRTEPSTSLNVDRCSITNEDMDMTMVSPNRHSKSLPTSTSSSFSNGGRNITESSMFLISGTGTGTDTGLSTSQTTPRTIPRMTATATPALVPSDVEAASGITGGSLSPTTSMASIRDISSLYNRDRQDYPESTTIPLDERLYSLVDRYGFLVEEGRTPTSDRNSARSSTLSSSRRSVRPSYDSKKHAKLLAKEQERSRKWSKMAKQYTSEARETEYSFSHSSKFVSRIYKGIPDCWRAAAWQCALFRVLKAYSNYNSSVGYCQGMASVVATMLTFFDEEKTFILLVQLFDRYNIKDLVVPGFPALFEAFYIQEELTQLYAPRVFQALSTMGIAVSSYASRWYITLYSGGVVPYRTLLRIWDIFLLEGFDWLYVMAIALLKYHEPMLVQHNFEQTMEMLNAKMDIQDDDRLLKIAQKLLKQVRQSGIVARLKRTYATLPQPVVAS